MSDWTTNDIPDLTGATALVTGATSGIGHEAARQLALHGATVYGGTRRGPEDLPDLPNITPLEIDMASMTQVRHAARTVRDRTTNLDLLIHCAGVMATPFRKTPDGFELELATNYLGPVLLTCELLPVLQAADRQRVVMVGSPEALRGKLNLDDLNLEGQYSWSAAYRQSKLADVMFAIELNKRANNAGSNLIAIAAHPGFTRTAILTSGLKEAGSGWQAPLMQLGSRLVAQPVAMGALPILYAATSPDAKAGRYYGPAGRGNLRGYPARITPPSIAMNDELRAKLWDATASMLGITFDLA